MAEQVRLTDAERRKFECRCRPGRPGSWQHDRRCIVPVVECIIAAHLQAARAEDAARLAEVERLVGEWKRLRDEDVLVYASRYIADLSAALGVTAPTASEAGA